MNKNSTIPEHRPFNVLGIAFVLEERGKGARLVFRYPVRSETVLGDAPEPENLFYTLPPHVMAKLFRPKKPLCGQPMTLSVGGTVFCCRAVLTPGESSGCQERPPVLFSVIVGLEPASQKSAIPISGWFEANKGRNVSTPAPNDEKRSTRELPTTRPHHSEHQASPSILSIRRVHVSLSRICRVLEREERRCKYVSVQSGHLIQVDTEFRAKVESVRAGVTPFAEKSPHHRWMLAPTCTSTTMLAEPGGRKKTHPSPLTTRQNQEQEIIELMLASGGLTKGNIARELVRVYHAISRNDLHFLNTTSSLLSESESTVFLNRHVAVPIAAANGSLPFENTPTVRPYHTLLFPHASSAELAQTIPESSTGLRQLLLMADPKLALSEIATNAALGLSSVIGMANLLVSHGTCIVSHVVNRSSLLAACPDVDSKMQDLALEFAQRFDSLPISNAVCLLTNGHSLGELIGLLKYHGEVSSTFGKLMMIPEIIGDLGHPETSTENPDSDSDDQGNPVEDDPNNEIEGFVFSMAVWLLSRRVIVPVEDYMIAGDFGSAPETIAPNNKSLTTSYAPSSDFSENLDAESLFEKLVAENCLNGNVSDVALSWRFRLDRRRILRLKSWGLQTGKLRSVSRIPLVGDDWDGVSLF